MEKSSISCLADQVRRFHLLAELIYVVYLINIRYSVSPAATGVARVVRNRSSLRRLGTGRSHSVTTLDTTTWELFMPRAKNVLGTELESCSTEPMTGFFRDGCCNTGAEDTGMHTVCAEMTDDFLRFSKHRGNDLSTPNPMFGFPGLNDGDRWCLCVLRWKEAYEAGMAPLVNLRATHMSVLEFIDLEVLKEYATGDSLD